MVSIYIFKNLNVDCCLIYDISFFFTDVQFKIRPWIADIRIEKPCHYLKAEFIKNILLKNYKCMADLCIFSCNDIEEFLEHIRMHPNHVIKCCYCKYDSKVLEYFKRHMKGHQHDSFQCKRCFYRSRHIGYVTRHIEIYHPESDPDDSCLELDVPIASPQRTFRKPNFPDVSCPSERCPIKFKNLDIMMKHLKANHRHEELVCKICKQSTNDSCFYDHLHKLHDISSYQCLFCDRSWKNLEQMKDHLIDHHASELNVYYLRENDVSYFI